MELIDSQHPPHQTLEIFAAKALADDDALSAYKFADRRCRIQPYPLAHCYVLRAEAAFRLGDRQGALADLKTAIEIAPYDIGALRRLLSWGDNADQNRAASTLIHHEQHVSILHNCIDVLARAGQTCVATAAVYHSHVAGRIIWDVDKAAEISLSDDHGNILTYQVASDPFHPLSRGIVRASTFRVPRVGSEHAQLLSISSAGQCFFRRSLPSSRRSLRVPTASDPIEYITSSKSTRHQRGHLSDPEDLATDATPTVIVPVYSDYAATKACIDGLLSDNPRGSDFRLIIIDDAAPDPAIKKYLNSLSHRPRVKILSNRVNVGFVGSVNSALQHAQTGDVVLLNADTLTPAGFVQRLAATARQSPDIGTVVPFSNNSEISDFPTPYAQNPIGTHLDIVQLDRVATSCNAGKAVDLPNGTGFCLYITRACLDAVGDLSPSFHRGYLEDVDFCLRARERGFRNVCAPSVYVGHVGSRSFKAEKRELVVQNLDVLDYRFPQFRSESAAFVALDPLRLARQAIERRLPPIQKNPILLFSGKGALQQVAQHRTAQLLSEGRSVIVLERNRQNGEETLHFRSADKKSPQSIEIGYSTEVGMRDLTRYLRSLFPSHCEIYDHTTAPPILIGILISINVPFDLWAADRTILQLQPQSTARSGSGVPSTDPRIASQNKSINELASLARSILVASPEANDYVRAAPEIPTCPIVEVLPSKTATLYLTRPRQPLASTLTIVPTRCSAAEFHVIWQTANLMVRSYTGLAILVAGSTLDDQRLMSYPNVFVTGAVTAAEFSRALQAHNVQWMLTGFDQPLFGHPVIEMIRNSKTPVAYIDWSAARQPTRTGDLALHPTMSPEQIAQTVCSWTEGLR